MARAEKVAEVAELTERFQSSSGAVTAANTVLGTQVVAVGEGLAGDGAVGVRQAEQDRVAVLPREEAQAPVTADDGGIARAERRAFAAVVEGDGVEEVDRFDLFRKKRAMSIYDSAGVISDAEAKGINEFARDLVDQIREWLAANHPELLSQ